MAENKEGINGLLEKLALITDATQNLFPESKSALIFELNDKDYNFVRINLNKFENNEKKFKVDISGVEIIFVLQGFYEENDKKEIQEPVKNEKNIFQKLRSYISGKSSI